ncbi:hypothetical protein KY343_04540 [Candidatus Woesearchaeota archaeon]|nr:hypothetical protein [Candidatus Woesearchaeota archaeon]
MTYYAQQKYKPIDSARIKYLLDRERSLVDFTDRGPDKVIEKVRLPWGFYGYTYLGHNKIWVNDRLDETPEKKKKTYWHEFRHTDTEYETRVLTDWAFDIDEKKLRIKIDESYRYN